MDQIREKLENGVKEIFTSEKYKDYINAMSKFPNYSVNNCILIASQLPQASLVCGYRKWQTDFNRTVNKGESGIMIMAPIKGKKTLEEEVLDEDGRPILSSDGSVQTEKVTKNYQTFRPAYVFDVSQTSGDPIPTLATMLTGDVESFDMLKEALIRASPVPIVFQPVSGTANGYYSPSEMKIVVDEDLSQKQMIKTMIHEMGHASLGHGSEDDKWDRKTKEVQAESVAYWVSQILGIDTSDYSFGYISGWSQDKEATDLRENLEIIKETAEKLSYQIEENLLKLQKETRDDPKETVDEAVSGKEQEQELVQVRRRCR